MAPFFVSTGVDKAGLLPEGGYKESLRNTKEADQYRDPYGFVPRKTVDKTRFSGGKTTKPKEMPQVAFANAPKTMHCEQGHYKEKQFGDLFEPTEKEKQRVKLMWKYNRGCQYEPKPRPVSAVYRSQGAAGGKKAAAAVSKRASKARPASAMPASQRRGARIEHSIPQYSWGQSRGPSEPASSGWGSDAGSSVLDSERWGTEDENLEQEVAALADSLANKNQLLLQRRVQSAKGTRKALDRRRGPSFLYDTERESRRAARKRPQSATVKPPTENEGISSKSRVGRAVGHLDKTSVLRMKVNLAFTQPMIPPPTPQLTGKARTARKRNMEVEAPYAPGVPVAGLPESAGKLSSMGRYKKEKDVFINTYKAGD